MQKLPKFENGKAIYRGFVIRRCQYAERSGRLDVYACGIWQFDCDDLRKAVIAIDCHWAEKDRNYGYISR